ncbi:MAG: sigma-70 family RNA polymerase sigma factor [Chloroflexi bacterium]|nr:MAG: sigma-70 family RNA polymerase sigma factor [Chloroflexota bacterium]
MARATPLLNLDLFVGGTLRPVGGHHVQSRWLPPHTLGEYLVPEPLPRRIRPLLPGVSIIDGDPLDEQTDDELVAGLAAGRIASLERLYDRYSSLVFSVSLRVLYDWQLAEDVTQEVFLRLWQRPESFDPTRGRLLSWLMSVTRNRAIDERRKLSRRARSEDQADPLPELAEHGADGDPPVALALAEVRRAVRGAMQSLPPSQRQVVELAYFGGLTQVEISERIGVPLGTVKTRVRLAMQKLRQALDEAQVERTP